MYRADSDLPTTLTSHISWYEKNNAQGFQTEHENLGVWPYERALLANTSVGLRGKSEQLPERKKP